ncbi:hypothetical protein HaLaN_08532 [Haematococcus lacustris]|uniref:Uncharacterized protein n=1 Tax=Haematococcus lacustris TaxID=44745 RepID=A0A699ZBD1_HAELA|nr:hypothetical protein HaLaN_08532 [Haematococcus lacustris]
MHGFPRFVAPAHSAAVVTARNASTSRLDLAPRPAIAQVTRGTPQPASHASLPHTSALPTHPATAPTASQAHPAPQRRGWQGQGQASQPGPSRPTPHRPEPTMPAARQMVKQRHQHNIELAAHGRAHAGLRGQELKVGSVVERYTTTMSEKEKGEGSQCRTGAGGVGMAALPLACHAKYDFCCMGKG